MTATIEDVDLAAFDFEPTIPCEAPSCRRLDEANPAIQMAVAPFVCGTEVGGICLSCTIEMNLNRLLHKAIQCDTHTVNNVMCSHFVTFEPL